MNENCEEPNKSKRKGKEKAANNQNISATCKVVVNSDLDSVQFVEALREQVPNVPTNFDLCRMDDVALSTSGVSPPPQVLDIPSASGVRPPHQDVVPAQDEARIKDRFSRANQINAFRGEEFDCALRAFARTTFDPEARIDVVFVDIEGVGEGAVDEWGPTREFCTLLTRQIQGYSIFEGPEERRTLALDSVGGGGLEDGFGLTAQGHSGGPGRGLGRTARKGSRADGPGARQSSWWGEGRSGRTQGAGHEREGSGWKSQGAGHEGEGSGWKSQGAGLEGEGIGWKSQGAGLEGEGIGWESQGAGPEGEGWGTQGAGLEGEGSGWKSQGAGLEGEGIGWESQGAGPEGEGRGWGTQGAGLEGEGSGWKSQGAGLEGEGSGWKSQGAGLEGEGIGWQSQGAGPEGEGHGCGTQGAGQEGGDGTAPEDGQSSKKDTEGASTNADKEAIIYYL
ncbi:hypothetical protein NQZ68_038974 [Dissostichus eleginoides]|nr:hypothetical protein NQZ68_038974 [Dissostichus eleginoides]